MRNAVKSYLALAGGLTEVTRQRATAVARALVEQGEATAGQVGELVEDLLAQSRQNRAAVSALVTYEVDRTLGRVGLATNEEVAGLLDRVRALEAEVRRLGSRLEQAATTPQSPAGSTASAGEPPDRTTPATTGGSAPASPTKEPARRGAARRPGRAPAGAS